MIFSLARWFSSLEKEKNTMDVHVEPVTRMQQQRNRKLQQIQPKDCLDDKDLTSDTSNTSNYVNNYVKEDNNVMNSSAPTMLKRITKSSSTPT